MTPAAVRRIQHMNTEKHTGPIDIILVTGFLGAGKTTFVNKLLAGNLGEGAGLLVNNFSGVVVDDSLSEKNEGLEIYQVSGGSLFCSCKTANFAIGLKSIGKFKPSRIIVEASGMSDPSRMDKLLADYRMAADFQLSRIVCLTDAVRTPKMLGTLTALRMQIEHTWRIKGWTHADKQWWYVSDNAGRIYHRV